MTNATTPLFTSTTVDALNAEIDALVEQILAEDAGLWPPCRGLCLKPFVDVTPDAIPADRPEAHDRVTDLIGQMPAQRLGHGRIRIAVPSAGHAITTAALLQALGTPAHAIHVGGTL